MKAGLVLAFICGLLAGSCLDRDALPNSAAASSLQHKVALDLAGDPRFSDITVRVNPDASQITLDGSVSAEQLRNTAINTALAAQPNVTVINRIEIRRLSEPKVAGSRIGQSLASSINDAWIYTQIETGLLVDRATPSRRIKVRVTGNVVTLSGGVSSNAVKAEAERVARETAGVRIVRNLLRVDS